MGERLIEIHFSMCSPIVEFLSHDETRSTGEWTKEKQHVARYIAPSKEIALAHFDHRYGFEQRTPGYKFTFGQIFDHAIDGILIEVRP